MATLVKAAKSFGKNEDLEMTCVDEAPTANQLNKHFESSQVITSIESQLRQLVEKVTKPDESVNLSVTNKNGFQEFHSSFVRQNGLVQSAPPVTNSKPQVFPRIQSVTSLAPKVLQNYMIINQNTQNAPVSSQTIQGVDYRYVIPASQQTTLVRPAVPAQQSIIFPSNSVIVHTTKASAPIKVSYQNVVVNKVKTTTTTATTAKASTAVVLSAVQPPRAAAVVSGTANTDPQTNYFYSSKQGDLTFSQQRGSYPFKCGLSNCHRILESNIVYMSHIRSHFEVQRVKNSSRSKLDCEHCFKAFPHSIDLTTHKEKVHQSSAFKCKTCEYTFPDKASLITHLGKRHKPLQMPYVCKLCGFMTSIYQDILSHFAVKHDRTKYVLCHLCLKVMTDVRNFFKHCQMHYQSTNLSKGHCKMCKLIFLNSQDFRDHTTNDHKIHTLSVKLPPKRQLPQIPTSSNEMSAAKRLKTIQPSSSNTQPTTLSFSKCFTDFKHPLRCCECGARANIQNHFRTQVLKCKQCRYQTYCQRSYGSHSNIFHNSQRDPPVLHPVSKTYNHKLVTLTCNRCFFTTQSASFMAWHVVICPKGSSIVESFCYRKNPAAVTEPKNVGNKSDDPIVIIDSDDEDEKSKITPTTSTNVAVNGVH